MASILIIVQKHKKEFLNSNKDVATCFVVANLMSDQLMIIQALYFLWCYYGFNADSPLLLQDLTMNTLLSVVSQLVKL